MTEANQGKARREALEGAAAFFEEMASGENSAPLVFSQAIRQVLMEEPNADDLGEGRKDTNVRQLGVWERIANDPELKRARQKVSIREISLIIRHVRASEAHPASLDEGATENFSKHQESVS